MKTSLTPPWSRTVFVSLTAVFLLSRPASGQITVTTLTDENDTPAGPQVSLREAVRDSSNGGQITLAPALAGKALALTGGEMVVNGKTISVNMPGGLVVDARRLSRIFRVSAGSALNLTGLTLQGGTVEGEGGAILSAGNVSLTDCVLRDNRTAIGAPGTGGTTSSSQFTPGGTGGTGNPGGGGGAVSSTGSLMALRCRFISNTCGAGGMGGRGGNNTFSGVVMGPVGAGGAGGDGGAGGAILSTGGLTLTECIFESNRTGAGGMGAMPGSIGSPPNIYGNGGKSGDGGAVASTGSFLSAERCSFFENSCAPGGEQVIGGGAQYGATGGGFAIFAGSGSATLTNCTVTANYSSEYFLNLQPSTRGGAVMGAGSAQLRLIHCTVADNRGAPPSSAAGIVSATTVTCENCITNGNMVDRRFGPLAPSDWKEINFPPDTPRMVIPFGPLSIGTPGHDAAFSQFFVNSLSPLPTLRSPPAKDAGAFLTNPPAVDQRGVPRAVGFPDLGAVETQPVEPVPLKYQRINFSETDIDSSVIILPQLSSGGMNVAYEVLAGPATVTGRRMVISGNGLVTVRATQPGDNGDYGPALPVVRIFEAKNFIPFVLAEKYAIFPGTPVNLTLPAATSAGLPVQWSMVVPPSDVEATLTGTQLTVTSAGLLRLRAQSSGNAQHGPLNQFFDLTFARGIWWQTPDIPFSGGPYWYTIVEGSPHGLKMTAYSPVPAVSPIPVPPLPGGLVATPSAIPVGETSVECTLTLPTNAGLVNQTHTLATGDPTEIPITFFLANRRNIPLDVAAPASVAGGTSTQVNINIPGVPVGLIYGPPPDLRERTVTVSAADFDNPAISVPVTLVSQTTGPGTYPQKQVHVTFPPMPRRVRLTVTTDDGITGQSGAIQVLTDLNVDNDGINDVVETALQRAAGERHGPPLTIERDAAGTHAVLGSRPRNLQGWTVVIEQSTHLQSWTPAPAAATTTTPNPDGTTDRVSVLLPADGGPWYVRLKVTKP